MVKFKLGVGDPYKDGHGLFETVDVESNKGFYELSKAHDILISQGIDLCKECCVNYTDNRLTDDFLIKLEKLGIDPVKDCNVLVDYDYDNDDKRIKVLRFDRYSWASVWLHLAKTQIPDLEFKVYTPFETVTYSIGGYGLFHIS